MGTSFPPGFPTIVDASLGVPVIGFGGAGPVHRIPVIFLHGNNDTPFPTACNPYGDVHRIAQYLADNGYEPSELWGFFPAVPAEDSLGRPHDFSDSASLVGAGEIGLTGQGAYDPFLGTSHLGIVNSPQTWAATLDFLTR